MMLVSGQAVPEGMDLCRGIWDLVMGVSEWSLLPVPVTLSYRSLGRLLLLPTPPASFSTGTLLSTFWHTLP